VRPDPRVASQAAPKPSRYPVARRDGTVDRRHGVDVADPYRWLEALDSTQTHEWVDAENRLTDSVLERVAGRDALKSRISALYQIESYDGMRKRGPRYVYAYNDGKNEQPVLLARKGADGPTEKLLDPNDISPDGKLAWAGTTWSRDGELFGYGLSVGGGDWRKWRFREVEGKKERADELEWIKYYYPQITPDRAGVYYSRFPKPERGRELSETDHDCKVYFHAFAAPTAPRGAAPGAAAVPDVVVYERPDHPTWQFEPSLTDDGRWLVIAVGDGQVGDRGEEQILLVDRTRPKDPPKAIVDAFAAEYQFVGSDGSRLFFLTTESAPRKRVIAIDTRAPEKSKWTTVVPEGPTAIEGVLSIGGQLLVVTLVDAHHAVTAYDLRGKKIRDLSLPGLGTVSSAGGGSNDKEAFFTFQSFTTPKTMLRHDLSSGKTTAWREPKAPFTPSDFVTSQEFYTSKDGTKIPLFVTSKRGLARDGTAPALLYAYGGFGNSVTPSYRPMLVPWLERGGIYAVANIRGGGEYGEAWHQAGRRQKKQVVFDDFEAAIRYLGTSGIAARDRIGVFGGSNGGLLIGATVTQHPELVGAAAAFAGVHDMLRFPLFGQGKGWEGEYGSPDDPDDFRALLAYSPVHNVKAGTRFPSVLIVTADHDVRVAPLHSYKLAAAMQAAQSGEAPVLLRVQTTAGHSGGTTLSKRVSEGTEVVTFFASQLGVALE
jgi:prolyl oligopeptidase